MLAKKKRGPAPTGKGQQVVVRIQPPQMADLDGWIAVQPDPRPTRAEAIRQLVKLGIEASIPRNSE